MACLSDLHLEFSAGKLAGEYLVAKSAYARETIYRTMPAHLKARVDEIIKHYEDREVERLGAAIAALKTRQERRAALSDVDPRLKERVRLFVVKTFAQPLHGVIT